MAASQWLKSAIDQRYDLGYLWLPMGLVRLPVGGPPVGFFSTWTLLVGVAAAPCWKAVPPPSVRVLGIPREGSP